MDNTKIINEIKELKKDFLLEINSWTTLGELANNSGTIILPDKRIYSYSIFFNDQNNLPQNIHSYIKEFPTLTDNQYGLVLKFIEEENLLDANFDQKKFEEAGFTISVKLNGKEKTINNCVSFDKKNPKIYDKLLTFIENNLN